MATSRPPDEKSIEVVFAAYAARLAHEMGKILITYAPSQAREKELAYDSRLISGGCRELYIQFKKSRWYEYGFAFKPSDKNQLAVLKRKYPKLSAFYVAAAFDGDEELLSSQHTYRRKPAEFLDNYIAVAAHALDKDSNSVRFTRDTLINSRSRYYPNHGPGHTAKPIDPSLWRKGCELLCAFLGGDCPSLKYQNAQPSVGCRIVKRNRRVYRLPLEVTPDALQEDYVSMATEANSEPIYIPDDEVHLMLRVFD